MKSKYWPNIGGFLLSIIASLIASGIVGLSSYKSGIYAGVQQERGKYIRQFNDAATIYANHLEAVIYGFPSPISESVSNDEQTLLRAMTIVSMRDDIVSSLESIPKLMNGEFNIIRNLIDPDYSYLLTGKPREYNIQEIRRNIEILRQKWPMKKDMIILETEKLITELGFEKITME